MSKVKIFGYELELPNIRRQMRAAWVNFWYFGKYVKLDVAMFLISLLLIIFVAITGYTEGLWGMCGIMVVYSYGVVIRLGGKTKEVLDLKGKK